MELPHQPPILFAKKVVEQTADIAVVSCEFPCYPTLGMGIEAAAQATAAFADTSAEGVLMGVNHVSIEKPLDKQAVLVRVEKVYEVDNMRLFAFEITDYIKGKVAVYVK